MTSQTSFCYHRLFCTVLCLFPFLPCTSFFFLCRQKFSTGCSHLPLPLLSSPICSPLLTPTLSSLLSFTISSPLSSVQFFPLLRSPLFYYLLSALLCSTLPSPTLSSLLLSPLHSPLLNSTLSSLLLSPLRSPLLNSSLSYALLSFTISSPLSSAQFYSLLSFTISSPLSSAQFFPLLRPPLLRSPLSNIILCCPHLHTPTYSPDNLEIPSRTVRSCQSVLLCPCTYFVVICHVESRVLGSPSLVRLWVLLLCVLSVPLNLSSAHALFRISKLSLLLRGTLHLCEQCKSLIVLLF